MRHWIFSCKKISSLISQSMDSELSFYKRMGIRFHLMMCVLCRRYHKQLLFIRSILRQNDETEDLSCHSMPTETRKRIEDKLKDEIKDSQD